MKEKFGPKTSLFRLIYHFCDISQVTKIVVTIMINLMSFTMHCVEIVYLL